jgi:DNA-binding transcriptional regulator YhcF (GntR family)
MEPLVVRLDGDDPEPTYQQIARQIRWHVASGRLAPGDALPGVRSLASDLGVNMNTVARAYRVLEEEGFVRIRDRSGVEVASPARRPDHEKKASLQEELSNLLIRMRQAGLTPDQVRRLVNRELDGLGPPPGEREA